MSIFKRLRATFSSQIDHLVGEIENHDAVVEATLRDMRKKVAEAKVRLEQVRREEAKLQQQINEFTDNANRWRQRAIDSAPTDETKALECLSRAHHCEQQVKILQSLVQQYRQTGSKLASDIELSERRLAEIKQKHTLMRARQSTSSAIQATGESNVDDMQMLEKTFDRWEINISEAEMLHDNHISLDTMEQEFIMQEQENELRAELAAMLNKEKSQ